MSEERYTRSTGQNVAVTTGQNVVDTVPQLPVDSTVPQLPVDRIDTTGGDDASTDDD